MVFATRPVSATLCAVRGVGSGTVVAPARSGSVPYSTTEVAGSLVSHWTVAVVPLGPGRAVTFEMTGGVTSGGTVVNVQLSGLPSSLPARSATVASTVTVYSMPSARGELGVSVAVEPTADTVGGHVRGRPGDANAEASPS